MKLEKKKYFNISIDTFRVDIAVFINYSMEEAIKMTSRRKATKRLAEYLRECDGEGLLDGANEARMYPLKQGYAVFLKFHKDSYRLNIATLSHEVSHLVSWILLDRRVLLSKESDEVYAYLTEEITKKILFNWY